MSEPADNDEPVSGANRWWFVLSAWVAVVLLTFLLNPSSVLAAPFFPIGLLALLPRGEEKAITGVMMLYPVFLGWGFYFGFQVIMMGTRSDKVFFVLYAVLCVLLLLNVGGCQRVVEAASQIQ